LCRVAARDSQQNAWPFGHTKESESQAQNEQQIPLCAGGAICKKRESKKGIAALLARNDKGDESLSYQRTGNSRRESFYSSFTLADL
jgi:hypothetical protein